jgi:hypothetical protein
VVIIDADLGDLDRRLRQLQSGLARAHLEPRTSEEKIVHLIPKRNIETWILNLNGSEIDEETDYRHQRVDDLILPAARSMFEWTRRNALVPPHCVPSLRSAIPEIARLEH